MRRVAVFAIVFSMVLGVHSVSYALSEFQVGLKLGQANPSAEFGDDFDNSFLYGIYGEVAFNPYFAIEGSFVRHDHDEDEGGLNELFPIHLQMSMFPEFPEENFDGDKGLEINELTLNGKVYLPNYAVMPYVTAGVGVYFWRFKIENLGDNTETDFGVNAGGGLLVPVTARVYLGFDVRYHYVYTQIAADEQNLEYFDLAGLISYGF